MGCLCHVLIVWLSGAKASPDHARPCPSVPEINLNLCSSALMRHSSLSRKGIVSIERNRATKSSTASMAKSTGRNAPVGAPRCRANELAPYAEGIATTVLQAHLPQMPKHRHPRNFYVLETPSLSLQIEKFDPALFSVSPDDPALSWVGVLVSQR